MELWSIEDARAYLGASSTGSARRTLSRWGVEAVRYERRVNGRLEARYDADHVRVAKANRPGRGARTDLTGKQLHRKDGDPHNNDPGNLELRGTSANTDQSVSTNRDQEDPS